MDENADCRFESTPWTTLIECRGPDSAAAAAALERLCRAYWPPVYSYLRRRGNSHQDARDLAQGMFARMLERGDFLAARPERGRFRNYLITCLRHFEANERERQFALKRGGAEIVVSLDDPSVGDGAGWEHSSAADAAWKFDRDWAVAVSMQAFHRLRAEECRRGRGDLFEDLRRYLVDDQGSHSRDDLARRYRVERATIDSRISKLRFRFRDLIRREVARLVASEKDEEIDGEVRHLQRVLAGLTAGEETQGLPF